jgi:c(7)-type cytochrome triheme protein
MIGLSTSVQRLCRLMCGRSLTVRLGMFKKYLGCAPKSGGGPERLRSRARWDKAWGPQTGSPAAVAGATAPQAAKPHRVFTGLLIESPDAFVFVGAVIALTLVTVFNSRASGPISNAPSEFLLTDSNQEQMQFPEGLDYGKFQHNSQNHSRLPCLLCHRRESNSPIPKRPGGSGHLPCAGCHSQQFAGSESPICTICHTDVKSGALKSFPRLKSFRMKFDHSLHVKMGSVSCATCHRPSRGGVALSIPAGFNAHTTCYGCHTPRAQSGGRDISSCGTCHQLGGYSRSPAFSQAFRVSFSHAKHQKVTCNECHQVRAGMPQRRQVTAPEPLNHHATGKGQSCMSCHDGKRAFGGDDFTVCKRCHTGATWHF